MSPSTERAPRRRPVWFGELALVALLLVVYDKVADLAGVRAAVAVVHGQRILQWEDTAHLNIELLAQQLLAHARWLVDPVALWYDFAHVGVTMAVLLAVWLLRPEVYRGLRNVLMLVNLLALAVFFSYPVAPPRLLPGAGFRDVVALSHTPGAWESSGRLSQHANEYASVPSLHVGYALWVVLAAVLCTRSRWLRSLAFGHLTLTVAVVLTTGNHYLFDIAAGGVAVLVAWWGAWVLTLPRSRLASAYPAEPARVPPPRLSHQERINTGPDALRTP